LRASDRAITLIKQFEGLRLDSYQDAVGVWTVGYGTTRGAEPDQHITEAEADTMLRNDLAHVEGVLSVAVTAPVTQNQFDALCSLAYNVGCGAVTRSTLLRLVNQRDPSAAALEFPKWSHAGGRMLDGLLKRRMAEKALFEEFS